MIIYGCKYNAFITFIKYFLKSNNISFRNYLDII